jgi:hypothetical protein
MTSPRYTYISKNIDGGLSKVRRTLRYPPSFSSGQGINILSYYISIDIDINDSATVGQGLLRPVVQQFIEDHSRLLGFAFLLSLKVVLCEDQT